MSLRYTIGVAVLLFAGCGTEPASGPISYRAERGTFLHQITARGSVFSEGAVEIVCEVENSAPEGTMILEIVPEGTFVKPGDVLVRLDASAIRDRDLQQRIRCTDLEAESAAATNEAEKARLSLEEFVEGLYPEQKRAAEGEIFSAESRLARAELKLKSAESDSKSGEGFAEDLEALRFEVEQCKREREQANSRLEVLEKYTKPRRLKQLRGAVETAEARQRAKEQEVELNAQRLEKINRQIDACTITAPSAGVVFYANVPGESEEDEILISEGEPVRQRQVILRISQLDRLSVQTEVAESEISHVKLDMPATVYVDSMPEHPFDGHVAKLHPYPTRETRNGPGKKRYEIHVAIDNPSGTLRPGLTAEVELSVTELNDAIQVPATSVYREGETDYCLVLRRGRWQPCRVVTGPSDDTTTVIYRGIEPGDEVAIHPLQVDRKVSP